MRRVIEVGLIAAIVAAVLSFGGTEPLSFAVVEILLFLLAGLLLWKGAHGRAPLRLPWLGPLLLLAYVVLGALSLPWLGRLSLEPHMTWENSLRWLAFLCAFYLCLFVCQETGGKRRLVWSLVLLGLFEAFYGLVQYLTGWQQIFTYQKRFYTADATGTYINRNHFAGLLEMIFPLVIALLFHSIASRRLQRERGSRVFFLVAIGSLILTALVFSRSRMGILSAVLTAILLATVVAIRVRTWQAVVVGLVGLLVVVSLSAWIGLEPVASRYAVLEDEYSGRWVVWKDVIHYLEAHKWLGTGLGTFAVVFPQYQTAYTRYLVDHAHNDYLEFGTELGLVGAAFLFFLIIYVLVRMLRAFFQRGDLWERALALGAAGSVLSLLLHSLTDFNLRIPANALVFSVILGLGYSTTLNSAGTARVQELG